MHILKIKLFNDILSFKNINGLSFCRVKDDCKVQMIFENTIHCQTSFNSIYIFEENRDRKSAFILKAFNLKWEMLWQKNINFCLSPCLCSIEENNFEVIFSSFVNDNLNFYKINEKTEEIFYTMNPLHLYSFQNPYIIFIRDLTEIWYCSIFDSIIIIVNLDSKITPIEKKTEYSHFNEEDSAIWILIDFGDHYRIGGINIQSRQFLYYERKFSKTLFIDNDIKLVYS